ncbi:hypothetical protein HNR16_000915 [Pseudoclavibacter chungangensis]|nr:hypothetical protein [Pseudoclavibacter chungangensis]
MKVRISPRFPLVWRSPDAIQLGTARPRIVVDDVDDGIDRLLTALVRGDTVERAVATAVRHGTSATRAAEVAALVAPTLEPAPGAERRRAPAEAVVDPAGFTLRGTTPITVPLLAAFAEHGAAPTREPLTAGSRDLLVVAAHYVVAPSTYLPLLADDRPHLAVTLEDRIAIAGPLVVPGRTPCIRCDDLYRRDRDGTWPTVATQLVHRRSPLDDPAILRQTADTLVRLALPYLVADEVPEGDAAARIDAVTGSSRRRPRRFHDECGCRALPRIAIPVDPRRGTRRVGPS